MNSAARNLPYFNLVDKLVRSTTRAYGEFLDSKTDPKSFLSSELVPDGNINRHFCWLAISTSEKEVRHLRAGTRDEVLDPLFTEALRATSRISSATRKTLEQGEAVADPNDKLVQQGPTRISRLIKSAMSLRYEEVSKPSDALIVPSPYSIVLDFLTIPEHPGSRAYAAVSLRTLLFQTFRLMPKGILSHQYEEFSVQDIETAYSSILTSMEERYRSSGNDKLDNAKKSGPHGTRVSGILRHYLAMTGVFNFWIKGAKDIGTSPVQELARLVNLGDIHDDTLTMEFTRPKYLKGLTEFSEIVNCLWGIPLPIRGADTIFRGGLNFSARGGLVCAVYGGPGSGKTALSLGIGAALSGFGIRTLFLTAEETEADLEARAASLLPSQIRSLSFVPKDPKDWLKIRNFSLVDDVDGSRLKSLSGEFARISEALQSDDQVNGVGIPLPCSTVVVLDGLHEIATQALFNDEDPKSKGMTEEFHRFIEACRKLRALVILTTGTDWRADTSLDYLVDVAMRLSHETESDVGSKPHRNLTLTKARHQLCSPGTHGLQIAGDKGVRFTPQMNYQLDRLSIWNARLPQSTVYKKVMQVSCHQRDLDKLLIGAGGSVASKMIFHPNPRAGVELYKGSNIFINGEGSGGKAGLALKIAIAPSFSRVSGSVGPENIALPVPEKVLVVSFLYPYEYYEVILARLKLIRKREYPELPEGIEPRMEVMHLYPGHLKPDTLFSKIEWALRASLLSGDPYTTIIIDGIHNVFLQFPEIEKQTLFWPQLFSLLRTRNLTTIITHTLLSVRMAVYDMDRNQLFSRQNAYRAVDDNRSDALRHALVLKTDFRLEVDPWELSEDKTDISTLHTFKVETQSAIGQPLPDSRRYPIYWSREQLVFFSESQASLPL